MTALEVVDRKWYVNLTEREKTDGKKQRPKISQAMVCFSCGLQLKKGLFAGRATKANCRVCGEAFCSKDAPWKLPIPSLGYCDAERICDGCVESVKEQLENRLGDAKPPEDDLKAVFDKISKASFDSAKKLMRENFDTVKKKTGTIRLTFWSPEEKTEVDGHGSIDFPVRFD